jgi:hypothetical protein
MSFLKRLFNKSEKSETPSKEKITSSIENVGQENSREIKIFPRMKVDYSHEIYKSDNGKPFRGNDLPDGMELPEDSLPIAKKLYEDLILCFAEDKGTHYEILQQKVLKNNPSLNEEILHQTCIQALVDEIGDKIKLNGDPEFIVMVTAGGNFEAALLLIETLREQIHQIFEGNVIIGIPARDLLFISKEHNFEAREKLKEIIKSYFDKPDTQGLLSKGIYLMEAGKMDLKLVDVAF